MCTNLDLRSICKLKNICRVDKTAAMKRWDDMRRCRPRSYLFPRQLLCRHFWTAQQRVDFGVFYLRRRLHHYSSVLHYMERQAGNMRDGGQRGQLEELLRKVGREGEGGGGRGRKGTAACCTTWRGRQGT